MLSTFDGNSGIREAKTSQFKCNNHVKCKEVFLTRRPNRRISLIFLTRLGFDINSFVALKERRNLEFNAIKH